MSICLSLHSQEAEKEQKEVLENETIKELTEKLSEMERRSVDFGFNIITNEIATI